MVFIKPSEDFEEEQSFRFNAVHEIVASEVAAVQNGVGSSEVNSFNRNEIGGADAHSFRDRMNCGRVPRRDGRVGLGYLLNQHGMLKAEATIANVPEGPHGPART